MTHCTEWEEPIALAAGGDLAPDERTALDGHVAHCPRCAALLADLEQTLGSLREAHAEPIAEAHFASVRVRVMAQVDSRPRRRWFGAGMAVATAALLLLALSLYKPAPIPRPPLLAVAAPPAPPLAQHLDRTLKVGAPVRRHARTRAASASERFPEAPPEPVTVKLLTDDPNVVIYWLGDPK